MRRVTRATLTEDLKKMNEAWLEQASRIDDLKRMLRTVEGEKSILKSTNERLVSDAKAAELITARLFGRISGLWDLLAAYGHPVPKEHYPNSPWELLPSSFSVMPPRA